MTIFSISISVSSIDAEQNGNSYSQMLGRAEKIVNYEWVPAQRIYTWNENYYNGKKYFEEGETVKGIPYTLFSWELGFDSLLSSEQYNDIAKNNYSTERYCNSVAENRIGPVYGNCCATFVSEVFGGKFMNGKNPRYDGVGTIKSSNYSTTYTNVKANCIQPGDALSCTSGGHIVWVSEVDEESITFYESTPPICKITVLPFSGNINENGYLVYGGNVYNIVSKSNEYIWDGNDGVELSNQIQLPLKAYKISPDKTIVYDDVNGEAKNNKIYTSDLCFIDAIYTNGWCHVTFPLGSGGIDDGYTLFSGFVNPDDFQLREYILKSGKSLYKQSNLTEPFEYLNSGETVCFISETDWAYQAVYLSPNGGSKIGWISKDDINYENRKNISSISIKSLPNKCTYKIGEVFDHSGLELSVYYDDGTTDVVTEGFTLLGFDSSEHGTKAITVGYGNQTSTFNIEVVSSSLVGDINNDNNVDLKDVAVLKRYLAGGWNIIIDENDADLNNDEKVDLKDVVVLKRYLAGGWGVGLI